jgi:FkbM family methyltransferase
MAFILPILKKHGHLDDLHMTICIVGSRKLNEEDDYAAQAWNYFAPNLSIYGFDADADACEAANAEIAAKGIDWSEKHIPLAIGGSNGEATLYVTKHPMCSSLYRPNEPFLDRFVDLSEKVALDFEFEIEILTLDEACRAEGIRTIDFLQIDVQGADLDVLKGAPQLLQHGILGVQIEVEFAPLYLDQPLFVDIDIYLRQQQFSLFNLSKTHQPRAKFPLISRPSSGQLLWGEAYYLRDLIDSTYPSSLKTPQNILKLACIADILDHPDYALELLDYLTVNYGRNDVRYDMTGAIVESIAQVSQQ